MKTKNNVGLFQFIFRVFFLTSMLFGLINLESNSQAEIFEASNAAEFQAALTAARNNGSDDTINLAGGTFDADVIGDTFTYSAAGSEQNSLTIMGSGADQTILESSSGTRRVLELNGWTNPANHITLEGVTIRNGSLTGNGGGLWLETAGNMIVRSCKFIGNHAYGLAGAAYISDRSSGNITLTNNLFSGNTADHDGGGLYIRTSGASIITLENNTFINNVTQDRGGGARIWYRAGDVILTANTFKDNVSHTGIGGGLNISPEAPGTGNVTLVNNIITGNYSNGTAGGVRIIVQSGTITLTNNTITGNSALRDNGSGAGGGIYLMAREASAVFNIYNNIIWNNSARTGGDIFADNYSGSPVNIFNNDYDDLHVHTGATLSEGSNISADPQFVSEEDFHIRENSPCIETGERTAPYLPQTDFEGDPRIIGAAPDMGVDENPNVPGVITYPTDPPPATFGVDITVRGKQYTAVGYDYSNILEEGQSFTGCVFDPTTGHLFVVNNNTDQVLEIDPGTGIVLSVFNLPSQNPYSFCLTIGNSGHLFFSARGHTDIFELTTGGSLLGSYSIDGETPVPWPGVQRDGMAYNPNTGDYYITESGFYRVTRDADGNFVRHEFYATQPDGCIAPRGIVYEPNSNTLLVLDDSSDRIYEYALDGTFIVGEGTRTLQLPAYISNAVGIAFDPATGRIFITGTSWFTQDPVSRSKLNILTPVIAQSPGDLDGDGAIDKNDLHNLLLHKNQQSTECPECDLDGDGRITVLDARKLILMCTRPRCGLADCYSFQQPASDLTAVINFTADQEDLYFEYHPGPDHSTDVSFDLYLDNQLVTHVGWVHPGGTSGVIDLPQVSIGDHVIELRNVTCPPGVGSCSDGQIISWAGKVCIFP